MSSHGLCEEGRWNSQRLAQVGHEAPGDGTIYHAMID
jgi:hypothetical protein